MGLGFEFEMMGEKEKKTEGAGSLKFSFFFLLLLLLLLLFVFLESRKASKASIHTYIHTCNYVCSKLGANKLTKKEKGIIKLRVVEYLFAE